MGRIDIRVNVSFKNNQHDVDLYNFLEDKASIMGKSSYIKLLLHEAMKKELELKK